MYWNVLLDFVRNDSKNFYYKYGNNLEYLSTLMIHTFLLSFLLIGSVVIMATSMSNFFVTGIILSITAAPTVYFLTIDKTNEKNYEIITLILFNVYIVFGTHSILTVYLVSLLLPLLVVGVLYFLIKDTIQKEYNNIGEQKGSYWKEKEKRSRREKRESENFTKGFEDWERTNRNEEARQRAEDFYRFEDGWNRKKEHQKQYGREEQQQRVETPQKTETETMIELLFEESLEVSQIDKSMLKKQYRKMAKKYHPDVNKSSNAEEVFKNLNEANEYLQKIVN